MTNMLAIARWIGLAAGCALVLVTWQSVIVTVIRPRAITSRITHATWMFVYRAFQIVGRFLTRYETKDRVLSMLGPVALLTMLASWLMLFLIGFAFIFWPLTNDGDIGKALALSGSSLFTLGIATGSEGTPTVLEFVAAATGMVVVALQIGYLPTIYGAYNRREALVTTLAMRAGIPSWGPEVLARHADPRSRATLPVLFAAWEGWAADMVESHVSYPWLLAFRSPQPLQSWIVAMLAVLDSAALYIALAPDEAPAEAHQYLQAGIVTLERLSNVANVSSSRRHALESKAASDRVEDVAITLTHERFAFGVQHLRESGFPITQSLEAAWDTFVGWRSRYEANAYMLADFIVAAPTPWSGSRSNMARQDAFDVFNVRLTPPAPSSTTRATSHNNSK